jgi:hypothetical protein
MSQPEPSKDDISKKRELSEAAKLLLEDKAFLSALLSLRQRWFGELLIEPGNTLRQQELCSMLRALELLPHELGTLVNDYRIALRNARGTGPGA